MISMAKRWHRIHDIPISLVCRGCDKAQRVHEKARLQVLTGNSSTGWTYRSNFGFLCPSCSENGIPSDVMTKEKVAQLVKQQFGYSVVEAISRDGENFYLAAFKPLSLNRLSLVVKRDSDNDTYHVFTNAYNEQDLGVLETNQAS